MNTDYNYFPGICNMEKDEKLPPEAKDFVNGFKSFKTSPEILYAIVQIAQDVNECLDILHFPNDGEMLVITEKVTKNGMFDKKDFEWLGTKKWEHHL